NVLLDAAVGAAAQADVAPALVDHRGRDDVGVELFRADRTAVALPDQLAGRGLEAVQPAVAAGEDDLLLAADHGHGRVRPLPFDDAFAGEVAGPCQGAGVLAQGDE